MKLEPGERVWAPADNLDLMAILAKGEAPPKSPQEMLSLQERMIRRMAKDAREAASQGEPDNLLYAESLLKDRLTWEERQAMLPLTDRASVNRLTEVVLPQHSMIKESLQDWYLAIRRYDPATPEASPEVLKGLEENLESVNLAAWFEGML